MKTLILVLLAAGISNASALNLNNAEEFQFVHCQTDVKKGDADHFVFDLRSEPHSYYFQKAPKGKKAAELTKLALLDSALESQPDSDDDVTWKSKKTGQKFKLYISDNAGYLMKGKLFEGSQQSAVSCSDISQEK